MDKKSELTLKEITYVDNLKIKHAVSFPVISDLQDFSYINGKKNNDTFSIFKEIRDVIITDHVLKRCDERVGPNSDKEVWKQIFKTAVISQPFRIKVFDNSLALLDDEIAFAYQIQNSYMKITTLFGRVSMNPSLANADVLHRYNQRYNEQINLSLTKSELDAQKFPLGPSSVIEFEDNEAFYRFELYRSMEENYLQKYYLCNWRKKGEDQWEQKLIDIQHANRIKLKEIELFVLGLLGHSAFILQYLKFFEPDRHITLYKTYSKRAIHRFMDFRYWKTNHRKKRKR